LNKKLIFLVPLFFVIAVAVYFLKDTKNIPQRKVASAAIDYCTVSNMNMSAKLSVDPSRKYDKTGDYCNYCRCTGSGLICTENECDTGGRFIVNSGCPIGKVIIPITESISTSDGKTNYICTCSDPENGSPAKFKCLGGQIDNEPNTSGDSSNGTQSVQ